MLLQSILSLPEPTRPTFILVNVLIWEKNDIIRKGFADMFIDSAQTQYNALDHKLCFHKP